MIRAKGCKKESSSPTRSVNRAGPALSLFAGQDTQAKLTGLTIDVIGLNELGQPAEPRILGITVPLPLPAEIPLTLYDPPCRYQVTARGTLTRETPLVASRTIDICRDSQVALSLAPFEDFLLGENPLRVPGLAKAGESIDVS
ncbi:hypothetical protein CSB45_02445 [candidate division KSB3 bacterium]|uniref:Uncharacterized protein n=1 Tax=candidate division KSB3 bacterium TaxID=2044937 RepID=A0A2G6E9W4_9BACT|nr:MAG: hypothetical protein CSB45_02445 [candidate division KSB3 bacterium]PIE30941.1 MAG: hypothetical protein CSA57_01060 [candidate division KSB3 bacterium]